MRRVTGETKRIIQVTGASNGSTTPVTESLVTLFLFPFTSRSGESAGQVASSSGDDVAVVDVTARIRRKNSCLDSLPHYYNTPPKA